MSLAVISKQSNLNIGLEELKIDSNGRITADLKDIDTVIYIGEQLSTDEYGDIEEDLYLKGVRMLVDLTEYKATKLKMAYSQLEDYMPKMIFIDKNVQWTKIKKELKTFIIRDDREFKGIYNWNTSVDELNNIIKDCKNPIVVEYLTPELDSDAHTEEYRIWMIAGEPALCTGYEKFRNTVVEMVHDKMPKINSKFYRINVIKLETGEYLITDIEDGQIAMLNESVNTQKKIVSMIKYMYEHEG